MLKFPFAEWYWLYNWKRNYLESARGKLDHMFKWVDYYEPGKYDVAILHLDQQCLEETIYDRGKGRIYQDLNEVIQDIPKIVIMHGTPYYPEQFDNPNDMIKKVKEIVGDNTFVVNSHVAQKQWGFGQTIIHGMDPEEWWDLPKEPRVVTMISPGGLPAYYDRPFLDYVKEGLHEKGIEHCHITVDYVPENWEQYREFLGRSLVYFNPTRESPMPRSRTEAMLSGCCVVTTPGQDADTFIKNGINGFLVRRDVAQTVDLIADLIMNNYEKAVRIGQEGKKTAQEIFTWDRYAAEWQALLNKVIKEYKK